ncbi:hypothetical protein TTHT_2002 [Thermotomaculum hydrothermale]|uniref:RHS repeat-associated core domain-containing protein n=1 Tax=Thermotomaculum hydrothermale TaxID=981385 RepID=A0A7R6SZ72_9BACT|nr:RHS repeat-associated core domain-containing protein [Thermotomaculum hydrothermale]BBB33445.1 hypothetical protein TTHT_2002 [Thermotomaculum hydrothermale]
MNRDKKLKSKLNDSGEILHTTDTLAYGEELTAPYENNKDEVLNAITYTGHEKDYETDLTYMLARYYSSQTGRFLSPDPGYDYDQLDPMSWNLYSYVRGNPITHLDPTGKWDEKKREEMRRKYMANPEKYKSLIEKLKKEAEKIDSSGDEKKAKEFVKKLDKNGLEVFFEDKNEIVRLGKVTNNGESALFSVTKRYNVAQSMQTHYKAMNSLSKFFGFFSRVPIAGSVFNFLSNWFGLNGLKKSDSNVGAKSMMYIIEMGMTFAPSPGEKMTDSCEGWGTGTLGALERKITSEKIDNAITTPIELIINDKLSKGSDN